MAIDAIILHPLDNVATAVQDLPAASEIKVRLNQELCSIRLREDIPYGHKLAVKDIRLGEDILKYGEVIGRATADIKKGSHAHVQNIESLRGRGDWRKEA
ncbi:MAG: UxaA family hydrolase [Clostridia bacterium]|jgi:altronate dehydratase small subunit|nr:UxaA family hydrolase [Clostridia bacterium]